MVATSAEKAYRVLLKEILESRLPRGEFLSQRKLAELAGTSVISVREALKQLENDGLLELIPRWGFRIPEETRQRIIERYALREAIEVMAAYLLSLHIDEGNAAELSRMAGECDLMRTDDPAAIDRFAARHRELHLFIAGCTGMTILRHQLERLNLRSLRYQSAKAAWAGDVEDWRFWHRSLAGEILSGDPQRAQEAMHRHIRHGLYHDLRLFDRTRNDTDAVQDPHIRNEFSLE